MCTGWCLHSRMRFHYRIFSRAGNLIEFCCIVFQLKVFQERELQAKRFWPLRVPINGAKDAGRGLWLRLKNTCKQFKFSLGSNSTDSVHASKRGIKDHCRDVFQCNDLLYGCLPGRSRSHELCVATILGWQRKNTVLSDFVGKCFDKTRTLAFM